ncbi:MAG: hypothetical protein M2R45_04255 [Verrucomicrobia subdivision 3 bacterium]|nr:hypothetical protein [Limisphaerales bacterium]MCS1412619.1 hypothetical protein [Limisphaerales bacterium]
MQIDSADEGGGSDCPADPSVETLLAYASDVYEAV